MTDKSKVEPSRKRAKTGGRTKGTPNKVTRLLRDDILDAASQAHPKGRIGYLIQQAQENPTAFMTLLGKVLPTDITSGGDKLEMPTEIIIRAASGSRD